MTPLFWTVFILVILIILFFIYNLIYLFKKPSNPEKWQDYMRTPLNYTDTGGNPMNFYKKYLYRLPYNYPYKFASSYPVPSVQYTTLL